MPLATSVRGKSGFFDSFRQTSTAHFALRLEQQRTPDEGGFVGIRSGGGRKNTLFNINTTITVTTANNNNNNSNNNKETSVLMLVQNLNEDKYEGLLNSAIIF